MTHVCLIFLYSVRIYIYYYKYTYNHFMKVGYRYDGGGSDFICHVRITRIHLLLNILCCIIFVNYYIITIICDTCSACEIIIILPIAKFGRRIKCTREIWNDAYNNISWRIKRHNEYQLYHRAWYHTRIMHLIYW